MATTTNYGWTTPDNTALVKDGASAIRTLGSSIDTTTKNLNPSTTLGDIEYRSSTANTNTRLPLGTAGQVLTVNSGATAPEWATSSSGGMTLLSTTTLSGTSTTISGISGSYTDLLIVGYGLRPSTNQLPEIAPNGITNQSDYAAIYGTSQDAGVGTFLYPGVNSYVSSSTANGFQIRIFNYANTSISNKPYSTSFRYLNVSTITCGLIGGSINISSAISSLVFTANGATWNAGTILLYGVK